MWEKTWKKEADAVLETMDRQLFFITIVEAEVRIPCKGEEREFEGCRGAILMRGDIFYQSGLTHDSYMHTDLWAGCKVKIIKVIKNWEQK